MRGEEVLDGAGGGHGGGAGSEGGGETTEGDGGEVMDGAQGGGGGGAGRGGRGVVSRSQPLLLQKRVWRHETVVQVKPSNNDIHISISILNELLMVFIASGIMMWLLFKCKHLTQVLEPLLYAHVPRPSFGVGGAGYARLVEEVDVVEEEVLVEGRDILIMLEVGTGGGAGAIS